MALSVKCPTLDLGVRRLSPQSGPMLDMKHAEDFPSPSPPHNTSCSLSVILSLSKKQNKT